MNVVMIIMLCECHNDHNVIWILLYECYYVNVVMIIMSKLQVAHHTCGHFSNEESSRFCWRIILFLLKNHLVFIEESAHSSRTPPRCGTETHRTRTSWAAAAPVRPVIYPRTTWSLRGPCKSSCGMDGCVCWLRVLIACADCVCWLCVLIVCVDCVCSHARSHAVEVVKRLRKRVDVHIRPLSPHAV